MIDTLEAVAAFLSDMGKPLCGGNQRFRENRFFTTKASLASLHNWLI